MEVALWRVGNSQDKAGGNEWEGDMGILLVIFFVSRVSPKAVVVVAGSDKLLLDCHTVSADRPKLALLFMYTGQCYETCQGCQPVL